jgi:tetratricopeptide (TPR) repeat protein
LILALALSDGGYGVSSRHIAGLAVWLILAAMLALGVAGRATIGRPFYWAFGLIGALALFSAFSSLWSGSVELSVIEADRILVYLGFFVAAFLIAQTDQRGQRFAEGIGIALIAVAAIALATRLLPHVVELGPALESGPRLRYPLGYWNADGFVFGIAASFALWMCRSSPSRWLRWISVGSLPTILLALYFTYSRGGLLSLAIACGTLLILSHDRLWILVSLAIGAIGALPAVIATQARPGIANNLGGPPTIDEGVTVLLLLIAGTALALALYAGVRRLETRQGGLAGRAVELSRNPRVLRGLALAGALLAIVAAIAVGGRAWSQFSSPDQQFPNNPEAHFGQLSGANRHEFWRVAIKAFEEKPVLGHGAGTYRFSWDQLRHISVANLDAHSLYLQAFAELGVIGGVLVLAMVVFLLWTGFGAWRAGSGRQRELYAVLFAVALAFAVGTAIDWFWQIAAASAVFFLASGVLVAARCSQLAAARAGAEGRGEQRRYGLAIAGLAIAWIAALALIGPLLVDREIDASKSALLSGNVASAGDHADTARSIEPWAASPYEQLALVAETEGNYALARERLNQAIHREKDNWLLYYLRARVDGKAGNEAAAAESLREARRLNPEEPCLREGFEGCG